MLWREPTFLLVGTQVHIYIIIIVVNCDFKAKNILKIVPVALAGIH